MKKLLIVNQPTCSNVFLVVDATAVRLLQHSYDRCLSYAQGYADASGLDRFEITSERGDCMLSVINWMNSPEAA